MKKRLKLSVWKILAAVFLLVFIIGPLMLYAVLGLGWPPVIGNLTTAYAMRTYAAEAHPEWEEKSSWAGYNLVNDKYYLNFTYGSLSCDRDNGLWLVRDEARENALRSELGIGWRLKEGGEPSSYVLWNAGWRPREPETPYITPRVDCTSNPGDPIPTKENMREIMADHAMEVYERLAPAAAVDRFSVHYSHHAVNRKNGGAEWNIITVDLPEGTELTREQILAAPLKVRTCIHKRGMLDGRGVSLPDKEIFRRNPDGFQGKLTRYGGERPGQTAFNTCEYRFYSSIQNTWQKRKGGQMVRGKAEDAGGLTPAKDDNAALRHLDP